MSEEEKKAIEKLKEYALCKVNDNGYVEISANGYKHTILNLIEKQQKEIDNLKEIEKSHQEENGLLRQELDMQIEHNKELEATLKQTQDSWFEDTQKLEQEKEKNKELEDKQIWNKGRIEELKKELEQEKEENRKLAIRNLEKEIYISQKCKFYDKMIKENYISKDKLKFILSKLNISDIEPWSTYKIDGQILFDLQELL